MWDKAAELSETESCMWFSPLFHFLLHSALQWGRSCQGTNLVSDFLLVTCRFWRLDALPAPAGRGEKIAFAWLRARKESEDTSAVGSERSLCSFEGLNIFSDILNDYSQFWLKSQDKHAGEISPFISFVVTWATCLTSPAHKSLTLSFEMFKSCHPPYWGMCQQQITNWKHLLNSLLGCLAHFQEI